MAKRTTPDEVRAITGEPSSTDVDIHIDSAALIVDEELVGQGLTDERLRLIELYLAAHFVALTTERGNLIRQTIGETREDYNNKVDLGLSLTRFGQQALLFDTTKILASKLAPRKNAEFRTLEPDLGV